jgi:hypothetical protein
VEYAPEEAVDTLRVDDIEPPEGTATDAGLKVTCGPLEERVEVKDTVPENPFRLVKVMVVVPDDP